MKDNFDNNAYRNEDMKWIKVPDKCCLVPVRLTSSLWPREPKRTGRVE